MLLHEIKEIRDGRCITLDAVNHMGERSFQTYEAWRKACKQINSSVQFEGDKDICQAKPGIGEWDGAEGIIYTKDATKDVKQDFKKRDDSIRKAINWEEVLWDCPNCNRKNAGNFTECPRCKTPRPIDTKDEEKTRRTAQEIKAEKELRFALSEEERYMGSVFANSFGQRKHEDRVKTAYENYHRAGGQKDI